MSRVHVACSARNAAPWLDAMLESLAGQSHQDWVLHIRDDGSTDATWDVIEQWQRRDARIATAVRGTTSLGSAGGFAEMLRAIPADASAIATADADDVWLPNRLESTLAALRDAEREFTGPVLVHSDVRVVDASLREIGPSFWRLSGMRVHGATPHMVAIENVAIGPTQLFNATLLQLVREMPPEAIHQDWWIALVAAAHGRIVAVPEATVLYRRHGANTTTTLMGRGALLRRLGAAVRNIDRLRAQLDQTSRQADAYLREHGAHIAHPDVESLQALAAVHCLRGVARWRAILRGRWHPQHSMFRNLGMVLRG